MGQGQMGRPNGTAKWAGQMGRSNRSAKWAGQTAQGQMGRPNGPGLNGLAKQARAKAKWAGQMGQGHGPVRIGVPHMSDTMHELHKHMRGPDWLSLQKSWLF